MNEIFREIILRVLCTGVICTVALIFAGDSAVREPVRIGCAAIMIIMLATPLKSSLKTIQSLDEYTDGLREEVEEELNNASNEEYRLVADKVKISIENRLKNIGTECEIEIETALTDGMFEIKRVRIKGTFNDTQESRITDVLAREYGVNRDEIIFEEIRQ